MSQRDGVMGMPLIDSIHELIDEAARALQRSVAVDDPELQLIGSSTHFESVDQARLSSLVGRTITGPLREYVMTRLTQNARETTVVPARPDLGLEQDRLCFPLRSRFELLGIMWIMVSTPLDDDEMEIAATYAARIQQVLVGRAQSLADADAEVESLVRTLLSPEMSDRRRAAHGMRELGVFVESETFVVIVVSTNLKQTTVYGEPSEDVVRRALSHAAAGRRRDAHALAASDSESTVILGYRSAADLEAARSLASALYREIQRLDPGMASATVIGIGAEQDSLESIAESYDQALVAVRIGRARDTSVMAWIDDPIDALLIAMLRSDVDDWLIPRALRTLIGSATPTTINLLRTFLDHAGNVIATAEALDLHRTTVYYRIKRFQETTGLDLDDGATRLLVHLWLRIRDLVGP